MAKVFAVAVATLAEVFAVVSVAGTLAVTNDSTLGGGVLALITKGDGLNSSIGTASQLNGKSPQARNPAFICSFVKDLAYSFLRRFGNFFLDTGPLWVLYMS